MKIKKLQGKISQLPDAIQVALFVAAALCVATVISIAIVETLMFFDRSRCLDSQYPRRWNTDCEEYRDGEWGEPSKDSIYYYNGAGSRITESPSPP